MFNYMGLDHIIFKQNRNALAKEHGVKEMTTEKMPYVIDAYVSLCGNRSWMDHNSSRNYNRLFEARYLRAEPVEELLKQVLGKFNASNYLGMHDDIIAAIDTALNKGEK
jgi:hypothetical protein